MIILWPIQTHPNISASLKVFYSCVPCAYVYAKKQTRSPSLSRLLFIVLNPYNMCSGSVCLYAVICYQLAQMQAPKKPREYVSISPNHQTPNRVAQSWHIYLIILHSTYMYICVVGHHSHTNVQSPNLHGHCIKHSSYTVSVERERYAKTV